MVETGRFGCAVAISITQANLFAIFWRSGALVDFNGIDAAVVPVYKNRNSNVIGVNGSSFVALASAFCGLFCGGCCTAGGGCCSFAIFSSVKLYVRQFNNIVSPENTRSHENSKKKYYAKKMQTKWEKMVVVSKIRMCLFNSLSLSHTHALSLFFYAHNLVHLVLSRLTSTC